MVRYAGMKGKKVKDDGSRIEIASYRLMEGTNDADFLQAVDMVMAELKIRNSTIGWQLFRGDDGVWVDIVSSKDWDKTAEEFKEVLGLPNAQRMYAMIDRSTLKYDTLTLERFYP
mgnify:CR=1 FL=1